MKKLSLLALFSLVAFSWSKELIQANMVFRHGDRSPIHIYPADNHTADQWPDGLGMLTQVGKEQQTRLGQFLRGRYEKLIGNKFSSKEIYVRSSDVDRTILSAYSNLAGLYNNSVQWDGGYISWQPVPVHTVPSEMDELLHMSRPCAAYDELAKEVTTPAMDKLRSEYSDFIEQMLDLTGYGTDSDEDSFDLLSRIRDTLFCERAHNMTWPSWTEWTNTTCAAGSDIPCFNRTVFDILSDMQLYGYYNQTVNANAVHKFIGGPLVIEMVDNLERKLADPENTPQLYIYSAHDHTMAAFLAALGAYNTMMPLYTATVMVELYKVDSSPLVEVCYKNLTDSDVTYLLNVSGCPYPCELSTFKALYESYRIGDWNKACNNQVEQGLTKDEIMVIAICLTVIVAMSLAAIICYSRKRRDTHGYVRVNT